MKIYSLAAAGFLAAFLAGCGGSKTPQLYYWDGSYNTSVYEYLNDEGDINKHIAELENSIGQAHNKGLKVPPGLHAHLGLLYSKNGDNANSKLHLRKEAELYPEFSAYLAFLENPKNHKKGAKNEK